MMTVTMAMSMAMGEIDRAWRGQVCSQRLQHLPVEDSAGSVFCPA